MKELKIRKPAVAGQFYPSSKQELKNQIEALINKNARKRDCVACMLPHAGYMYSGLVAGETVSHINIKDKIILLGPNHTGYGKPFSIMTEGVWQTPLGDVRIDSVLAHKILNKSSYLEDDDLAHVYEHSLEVELPFLQYFKSGFEIVPIAFASDDLQELKEVGKEIASAIQDSDNKGNSMLLASSDMTHYEAEIDAQNKDKQAIDAILDLNEDKLMEKIRKFNISMCGYAPVIVMLKAAKILGAKTAELVKYQTSGDVTGDKTSVVGYAGIAIY
jgi:AmmeMemoRadiSam system protein B